MKRTSHAVLRVAASALVVLIWVIYLFERWSGQYAMYPLIGYVGYECLSIAAGACFWALLIWLLAVLIQVLRRKAPNLQSVELQQVDARGVKACECHGMGHHLSS